MNENLIIELVNKHNDNVGVKTIEDKIYNLLTLQQIKNIIADYNSNQVQAEVKVQIAEVTNKEVEEYIDKYIDMGCFRSPEIARPYLLDGFQLGCKYTKKKFSNLSA